MQDDDDERDGDQQDCAVLQDGARHVRQRDQGRSHCRQLGHGTH